MDTGKVLDAIEELIDKIDDLNEFEDLMDRYEEIRDKYERGEQPDPSELADLLADTMTYLTGKFPLGPYAWLVKLIIEFVKRAIEAGYYAGLGIAWQRYKALRIQGWDHESACEQATQDPTICRWLRLKWLEKQQQEEAAETADGNGEEGDADEEEPGEGASPLVHTPPGPRWPTQHHNCCSNGNNGTTKPTIAVTVQPTFTDYTPPVMPNAKKMEMQVQVSHPCGIASSQVKVYNSLPPSAPGGPLNWTRLMPKNPEMVKISSIGDGKRDVRAVVVTKVKIVVVARSNCVTFKHQVFEFDVPT